MYNTPMIFSIKAHLHKRMLDFNGDRVKLDEWRPILRALSLDRSLHLIAIRSKTSCSKGLKAVTIIFHQCEKTSMSIYSILICSQCWSTLTPKQSHELFQNCQFWSQISSSGVWYHLWVAVLPIIHIWHVSNWMDFYSLEITWSHWWQ